MITLTLGDGTVVRVVTYEVAVALGVAMWCFGFFLWWVL